MPHSTPALVEYTYVHRTGVCRLYCTGHPCQQASTDEHRCTAGVLKRSPLQPKFPAAAEAPPAARLAGTLFARTLARLGFAEVGQKSRLCSGRPYASTSRDTAWATSRPWAEQERVAEPGPGPCSVGSWRVHSQPRAHHHKPRKKRTGSLTNLRRLCLPLKHACSVQVGRVFATATLGVGLRGIQACPAGQGRRTEDWTI